MGSPTPPPPPTTPSSRASCYSLRLRRRRAVAGLRRNRQPRGKMKLMYFLMDGEGEEQRCRAEELRLEVSELEAVLAKEERLSRVLRCSLQAGRLDAAACRCCLSAHLVPAKIRGLLAELAIVEDEIFYLEKKVDDLRTRLLRERNWTHHCILQQQQRQRQQDWPPGRHCIGRRELHGGEQLPRLPGPGGGGGGDGGGLERESKASAGSASSQGEETDQSRRSSHSFENLRPPERKICSSSPNKLSEELIKLTVTIFHKLSRTTDHADPELELSSAPKLNITSCIGSSRSLAPKLSSSSSSDRAAPSPIRSVKSRAAAPLECGGDEGEPAGRCERFVEFTRSSFDSSRVWLCLADIKNLRVLMNKLCTVDPSFLTNKQKLAFWLNIYNFCVMHAFLQHGLPPSPDKLLALLNQASVNVGGRVLSVLSIERLFLRHPPDEGNKQGMMMEEGERDMQLCYGLGYPEPNVVFALCRGSRSSPPVRVYTAEEVSSELEAAKVEYLERCVRVAGARRKKAKSKAAAAAATIVLPKLLHWHMRCFADDVESLLEWVHSQLPRATRAPELKRAIRELLHRGRPPTPEKMVEIEPYDTDFRYLLPLVS
ncbi:unnamed protein product [Triticum turgidum subsp. durum]|uniref:DUF547 domain-containing protein n=1 Tax=Triticum turgidum subsp. durum TaxID=4567 RepID=A0A9R1Q8H0_TRITD|nr:unnamed protein product [Triticum turgidum subsp. durum]